MDFQDPVANRSIIPKLRISTRIWYIVSLFGLSSQNNLSVVYNRTTIRIEMKSETHPINWHLIYRYMTRPTP